MTTALEGICYLCVYKMCNKLAKNYEGISLINYIQNVRFEIIFYILH